MKRNTQQNIIAKLLSGHEGETRALIGGGGVNSHICSCSVRLISFGMNLKTTDFKRNWSGRTRIYEYSPPPPPRPPPID